MNNALENKLEELKPAIREAVEEAWGPQKPVKTMQIGRTYVELRILVRYGTMFEVEATVTRDRLDIADMLDVSEALALAAHAATYARNYNEETK